VSASDLTTAEQQAALRRVALLVANGGAPADVFEAIAQEVAELLRPRLVRVLRWEADGGVTVAGSWGDEPDPLPSLVAMREYMRTGQPVRSEEAAGAPIVVDGAGWGHIGLAMAEGMPLPEGTEERLAEFTELVAAAISSSETREQYARLADEQAALRRVATLVATGAPPAAVFDAVAAELGRLLDAASSGLIRFEDEHTATLVAGWGRLGEVVKTGARLPIGGVNVITKVARSGRPARIDDYDPAASGEIADHARRLETSTAIGSPLRVAGRLWGAIIAATLGGATMPADAQSRLEQFTELIATAISNTEARVELARLADEQAALRRVATLVAEEAPAEELFAKVAEEVGGVFGQRIDTAILRYEPDETATVVAVSGAQPAGGIRVGVRMPIDGSGISATVYHEQRPVRLDDYGGADGSIADHAKVHGIRAAVGCPILVRGRPWGAMVVAHYEERPFPPEAERHVSQFTELVATAIANAEARAELERLAAEQAVLRRVATLVAEEAAPSDLFDAVIDEIGRLLGAAQAGMMRYESPQEATIVAQRGQDPSIVRIGMRMSLEGDSVSARVLRTGRAARINHMEEGDGDLAELVRRTNVDVTIGAPITVENRLWGVIAASWKPGHLPPAGAEERLAELAGLIDTAIANAHSRDQLTESRARVITAGDEARRRVVRDLHDGAQQRLVHSIVSMKLVRRALRDDPEQAETLLAEALAHAEQGNLELRELAHGILPAVLTRGGLADAVDSLVARLDLPIRVDVPRMRLPPEIESSAYFIVAEALTNVVKHSQAARAQVTATLSGGTLRVEVRDDGVGGADPDGYGLLGIGDRAAAMGGRVRIASPPGAGTVLTATLPLAQ
jgi:signal transduction histidine kinase